MPTNQCKSLFEASLSRAAAEIQKPRIVESAKQDGDTFANGGHSVSVRPSDRETARKSKVIMIPKLLKDDEMPASKKDAPVIGQQTDAGTTGSSLPKPLGDAQSRRIDKQAENISKRTTSKPRPSAKALRDSEARYRRLFEAAQDGILILDAQTGLITDVNPFLVKLLDYSREEFLGKALWDIGPFKDIEASKNAFRELQATQYVRYEDLPLKTRGGRSINVEFVSNVYGVNGTKVIQCNIRDITERKQAEYAERQLRQAQKMEAVGHLAGGIAHDFNNLLGVILGYCEVLEERSDLAELTRKMIVEIHNAGTCAKDLTRRILAFSHQQVLQPAFLDLNATVDGLHPMLCRLIGDDIEIVKVLESQIGTIKIDPSQIEQVLMNLVLNARDAMPKGGTISIATANVQIDEAYVKLHPLARVGQSVMLTVSDTGIGMDTETQSRIFEPFFTTKEGGTGLGLSTVFGIIKQSAGGISVVSEERHGTTFTILLPRHEDASGAISQSKAVTPLRGGSETILLVEDAAALRELTRQLLEDCGYMVLDSGNAADALRTASEHKGPLPLMITDIVMPGISGFDLAQQLAEERPDMHVLYTSGYALDAVAQRGPHGSDWAFLEKPFTRDALIRKVRELLDSSFIHSNGTDGKSAI